MTRPIDTCRFCGEPFTRGEDRRGDYHAECLQEMQARRADDDEGDACTDLARMLRGEVL